MDGATLAASPMPRQSFGASSSTTSRKRKRRCKRVAGETGRSHVSLPAQALQDTGQDGAVLVVFPCPCMCLHPSVPARPCPVLPRPAQPCPFSRTAASSQKQEPAGRQLRASRCLLGCPGQVTVTPRPGPPLGLTVPWAGCLWRSPARSIFLTCRNLLGASRNEE